MSYGYGDWNSGTSRGYEGYGYGYGFGPEGSGPLGYPGGSWGDSGTTETPPRGPDGSDGPGKGRGETGVTPEGQGRGYGGSDRYEPYESYGDSRDLYRAPFDYPNNDYPNNDYRDYPNDYPSDYPNDYRDYHNDYHGDYHDYPNNDYPNDYPHHNDYHPNNDYRDYPDYAGDFGGDFAGDADPDSGDFPREFPGRFREDFRGWAREQRSFPGRGSNRRLPSLFAHNILPPEAGAFPGLPRGFPGAFRGLKRIRRGWKVWDADFRPQRKRLRRDSFGKRRKAPGGPGDKTPKTDGSDNSSSDNEEGTEGESGEKEESRGEGEDEEGRDSEKGPLSLPEENSQLRQKLQGGRKSQDRQKKRHRDRMVERIQFVCSLCKFRTFFEDEIQQHLESKFHREHFQFVGTKLPPQTAQFLQEYVANKTRKTEERRRGIRDINGVIQQIQREQDLTQEVGLEHFLRKVEAAHCSACDLLIPMHFGSIHKHLKSPDHNHNRRVMLEQSKRSSLVVARSILNNKLISKKLHRFLRGENPFTDDPEEGEGAGEENPEENPQNLENPEENPQNPEENPQNPEENPQNLEENSPNSKENPQNSEENSQNPEENPQNCEENPQNSEENSQNSKENPQNSEENPQNSEENPQNSKENPQNFEEKPKIPEDVEEKPKIPEENPKVEEIPGQEKGTGTNPEGENSPKNSPNSEKFPEEFPREEEEENSGMCQE